MENILKESRSAIIDLLKTNGAMSVEQLAQELGVTKVCIRRHLGVLERDGLIDYSEERHERGRPRFIYRLTDKGRGLFPHNYAEFARDLLSQIRTHFGEDGLASVISARADSLIERFGRELGGLGLDESIKVLARTVNSNGYLTDARRLKDGTYRLRHHNCPTEDIAVEYPAICDEEVRVYRESLGCEVVRECRIVDGARMCEFRIKPGTLTQISLKKGVGREGKED